MKWVIISLLFILASLPPMVSAQENVTPQLLTSLGSPVSESSGLLNIDGNLWTHNDSGGNPALYKISKTDGSVLRTVVIQNATNVDWEDLAYDSSYVYIGDFGNNSGSRTDLKIYRISRSQLSFSNTIPAETINFSYSDQTSWDPHPNQTDFDCEAFISWHDTLYLFSKDWVDQKTRMYKLSSQPGTYVAGYTSTFDVAGLVTSAEMLPSEVLLLQGYSTLLTPFTRLFQQFQGDDFFQGTSIRLNWTMKAQTEGICYSDSNGVYVTSETAPSPLPYVSSLYYLDISDYLAGPSSSGKEKAVHPVFISGDHFTVNVRSTNQELITGTIRIMNSVGKLLSEVRNLSGSSFSIPVLLQSGVYIVTVETEKRTFAKKILIP